MNLLTANNPKTNKSIEYGYLTGILHMKPDYEICPHASKGCMAACLNTAGRGGMPMAQTARARRTLLWKTQPEAFKHLLIEDINTLKRRADKLGLKLAIRLNGTGDVPWEFVWPDLFKQFNDVQFYDYTPNPYRMRPTFPNYHLTFSAKENNDTHVENTLINGYNVAVVFRNKLPETYLGIPVVDGDKTDLRFIDPHGVVVGLIAKGKAKKDTSGFVKDIA